MPIEDSQIIELFNARSERAIIELSNKYGKLCHKVALNILNNTLDAEECVNDAYMGIWNSIPPHNPNPLRSYVCRIVRNLSLKRYHANTAVKRNSFYDVSFDELEDCIPTPALTAESDMQELSDFIDEFLATLDSDNRIMFMRRYWFSDSLSNIAELFGITKHNAAVRLYRTRKKMRKFLTKRGVSL